MAYGVRELLLTRYIFMISLKRNISSLLLSFLKSEQYFRNLVIVSILHKVTSIDSKEVTSQFIDYFFNNYTETKTI